MCRLHVQIGAGLRAQVPSRVPVRVGTSEAGLSQRLRGTARSVSRLGLGQSCAALP
jgi:hypothetical protein